MAKLEPSATLVMNEMANRLKAEGRDVYRFGFGQSPFPVPDEVVEALRANAHQKDYLPVRGLPSLRSAVAAHLVREYGIDAQTDRVFIGPGSKELIFLLQLALDADLVLPAPSWVSYAPQARMLNRKVHLLPTRPDDRWQLDAAELERICLTNPDRTLLLILTDPSNPTGTSHSTPRQRQIAEVARRYGVVCLSDEIYAGVTFDGRHHSMAVEYPEGTIVSTGLSKWCGAGGWRLGTFLFPEPMQWLLERVEAHASETFTAVSAPIQYAAVSAYEGGELIDEYLFQVRRILAGIASRVTEKLTRSEIRVAEPDGGFYVFPDFASKAPALRGRAITSSQAMCNRLLEETGVALLPGEHFNMPRGSLTARLAFVDFDGRSTLEAASQQPQSSPLTDDFFARHVPRVLEGVDLLIDWSDRGG